MATLVNLPNCLKIKIVSLLSLRDLNRFLQINHQMSQLRNRAEIWRNKILQTWPKLWPKSLDCDQVEAMYKCLLQDHKLTYPTEVIELLFNHGYYLSELPILDLGLKIGATEYIDFVKPEDMTAKIMRFTDCLGRIGLIFRLKGLSDESAYEHCNFKISDIRATLALFKRYPDPKYSVWSLGWGGSTSVVEHVYNTHHQPEHLNESSLFACEKCPFARSKSAFLGLMSIEILQNLLTGRDTLFALY